MMTLEEAIKHCKDVALSCTNKECALEHFQLLKWLQEYRSMLEKQGKELSLKQSEEKMMYQSMKDDVRRRSTIQVLEYARNLDAYNKYGKADIDKNIAWLERIGEKPQGETDIEAIKVGKVDNQNCTKPTDKVKPKFHKGEWVVWNNQYYKVNYNSCGYELVDQNGLSTSLEYGTVDKSAHVFSIKDTKDGDVLVCEDFGYTSLMLFESFSNGRILLHCWHNSQTNNFHINTDVELRKNAKVYPATKEQRDTLMKAMTDAGWDFDFEKKELKKIENKNPLLSDFFKAEYERGKADGQKLAAWSDEDEEMLNSIIDDIEILKSDAAVEQTVDILNKEIDWLKSLRPQNRWKPSDEQMKALNYVINLIASSKSPTENELYYNILKSLENN